MKTVVDTNVLVRAITRDDPLQAVIAERMLAEVDVVVLGVTSFCELAWVLGSGYGFSRDSISAVIQTLLDTANVETDRAVVEFGLSVLEAGGDFADGVIAFEGERLGGETFVSFDKRAVRVLAGQGVKTLLLSSEGRASE